MNTTRATLYLDTELYKAFKIRAVETGHSFSELMNDALRAQLAEDLEDIRVMNERLAKPERTYTYDEALEYLRKHGQI